VLTAVRRIPWLDFLLLLIGFGALLSIGPAETQQKLGESNLSNRILQIGIIVGSMLVAIAYRQVAIRILMRSPLLIAFVLLAFASALWSDYPAITLRRDFALMAPLLLAYAAACRYETDTLVKLFGWATLVFIGASVVVVFVIPSIGIMRDAYSPELNGAWRGITTHKSSFGYMLLLAFQVLIWRAATERAWRWTHILVALVVVAICFKARSATALLGMAISVGFCAVLVARRTRTHWGWMLEVTFWAGLIGALLALPLVLDIVLELFGKDASLTGRIPLWNSLMPFLAQRPILGWGYGAFWIAGSTQTLLVQQLNPWSPPDAHNAFLGVALELGLLGAGIAILILLSTLSRAYRLSRNGGPAWSLYLTVMLGVYVESCMTESPILAIGSISTFLLAYAHFSLVKHRLRVEAGTASDFGENLPTKPAAPQPSPHPTPGGGPGRGLRFRSIAGRSED
jgi:O-antigen ligase